MVTVSSERSKNVHAVFKSNRVALILADDLWLAQVILERIAASWVSSRAAVHLTLVVFRVESASWAARVIVKLGFADAVLVVSPGIPKTTYRFSRTIAFVV